MRLPLFVLIPVASIICAGIIGVTIGLTNLGIRDATDSYLGPVIFAGSLTIVIMAVATYLSYRSPSPDE